MRNDMQKCVDDYVGGGGHPSDVLDALSEAAYETASHLEGNWQDRAMARVWTNLAKSAQREAAKWRQKLRGMGYR